MSAALDWLSEEDAENPGVRYFALIDLLDRLGDDPEVLAARRAVMESGAVPAILAAQDEAGFWVNPGEGYLPKYRSTVWSMIYLAQLGADPGDPRVRAGGDYLLDHARASTGMFSLTGTQSGSIYCLAGNLGAALLDLGFGADLRLREALEMMARFVTGQDVAPQGERDAPLYYLKSGMCGPGFCCSATEGKDCGWGAVKVLRALARVPVTERTSAMQDALEAAVEFLLSADPATAEFPTGYGAKPSRSWFRFGFPVFYVTDVLQTAEALTEAGYGGDPRLAATYELVQSKRDKEGRLKLEYHYKGKTFADIEQPGKPSKWVTLRALRVLKGGGIDA